jgi:hypothetical protein
MDRYVLGRPDLYDGTILNDNASIGEKPVGTIQGEDACMLQYDSFH